MVNSHKHLFKALLKWPGVGMVLMKHSFTCTTGLAALELMASDAHTTALHGCIESVRSGVPTLVGFKYVHSRPSLTQTVVDACKAVGMPGFVCCGFLSDRVQYGMAEELIEPPQEALVDLRALIEANNRVGRRVQVGLAPCVVWALDDASLQQTHTLADELGVQVTVNIAETSSEIEHSMRVYRRTDTEVLSDLHFLGPDVLPVHCVQCNSHNVRLLQQHDTKVSHNPCSNMYLAPASPRSPRCWRLALPFLWVATGRPAATITACFRPGRNHHNGAGGAGDGDNRCSQGGRLGARDRLG